jgi:hypothetical protein
MGTFPQDVFYDWWLLINAAVYGKVAATNEVFTFHRFHSENLTLGKKDERYQTREKAEERTRTVRQILSIKAIAKDDKLFATRLLNALENLHGQQFSRQLFFFLLKHANTVFFFKKKSWFSRAKMAWRLSFAT